MIRISLTFWYELGSNVHALVAIPGEGPIKVAEIILQLYAAQSSLSALLAQEAFKSEMKASLLPAQELLTQVNALFEDFEREVSPIEIFQLQHAARNFETIFKAEMQVANIFLATQKRGYDTLHLIQDAEVLLPDDLASLVPEAIPDIREAGKCIAFELGTAAGFHITRAIESVLLAYWDKKSGGKPRPTNRNLGAYLRAFNDAEIGDPKVLAVLDQVKDLHRNPLIHPEERLSLDEAISLLGVAQSAIIAMLNQLR